MYIYIIVILTVILTGFLYLNRFDSFDYVFPRYREDTDWLKDFSDLDYYIYNKGPEINITDNVKLIKLPNIGRDSHTVMYHIVNNYDNLSEVTIFGANSTPPNFRYEKVKKTIQFALSTKNSVFICEGNHHRGYWDFVHTNYVARHPENAKYSISELHPSPIRPYGKWYESIWPNITHITWMCYGLMFAVHKDHILQHPKQYYQNLLDLHVTESDEITHYIERATTTIFWPYPMSCVYNVISPVIANNNINSTTTYYNETYGYV